MGRKNSRGLLLSFKPVRGGRGRGRWYKKVQGQEHYFGWGNGVSDRDGYQAALVDFRLWSETKAAQQRRTTASGMTRVLQHEFSVLDVDAAKLDLERAREKIAVLGELGGASQELFAQLADGEEKRRLLEVLSGRALSEVRRAFDPLGAPTRSLTTSAEILDEFLTCQRQRMERRQRLDALRESGQFVQEAPKQNLSEGRFAAIVRDVAAMKKSVGSEVWSGTESGAAAIIRRFREEIDKHVLDGSHSPHTFNDRIKLARMVCAWAEANYRLDRLPRDRSLFAKYSTSKSTAKAIPLGTLRRLWTASDDRGRCWLLLGLNCGYYAQDISDLKGEMVEGKYLNHFRGKSGVRVRYKLWKKTREYLKKFTRASGPVFVTESGTRLVHHSKLKKSGEPVRIDNVRNWFYRLCHREKVEGFSFSNVRDTASTQVEMIDRNLNDLFLAHRDPRMATLYVDGTMVDSRPLDKVIDLLERRVKIWS